MATLQEIKNLIDAKITFGKAGGIRAVDHNEVEKALADFTADKASLLQSDIDAIEAGQIAGLIGYTDKASMDADTTQTAGTVARVSGDATAFNNGYYRWNGTSWVKQSELYAQTVDPTDTSAAVVGKAVGDWTRDKIIDRPENDWYDPDFIQYYPRASVIGDLQNMQNFDLWWETQQEVMSPWIEDGRNCARVIYDGGGTAQRLHPNIRVDHLQNKGWNNGDTIKLGLWIKFPAASAGDTRTVYMSGNTVVIDNSEWNWIESGDRTIDTSLDWYNAYLFVRYGSATEECLIRGFTLVDTTIDTWNGERKSKLAESSKGLFLENLNNDVVNITESSPLYSGSKDLGSVAFTKSIKTTQFGINSVEFTGTVDAEMRLQALVTRCTTGNSLDNRYLLNQAGKLKIGFFVKINNSASNKIFIGQADVYNTIADKFIYERFDNDKWYWVESPIFEYNGETTPDHYPQVRATPSAGLAPIVEIAGVTVSYVDDNPLAFKLSKKPTHEYIFKNKNLTSYGDSITAANNWQPPLIGVTGGSHSLRGIGGTTMVNKGSIAWVDVDGNYLARPPASAPSGTEGVDYFEIDSSMCRQERVDTIPIDTDVLFVLAGANDWGSDQTLGTRYDAASDALNGTFYAAYKSFFEKIAIRIPNARIVVLNLVYKENENSTTNGNGKYYWEFRQAIDEVATMYGHPVIYTNDVGVNDTNWASYSPDTVHPNDQFGYLIAEGIHKKLSQV